MTFMATRGKREVDPSKLSTDDMELNVIAHSLAQINRFAGHLTVPYSVAQHSVWVSVKIEAMGGSLNIQKMGLMHDGSESFLSDLASPYKKLLPDYQRLEKVFQDVVYEAFGIHNDMDTHLLKYCDTLAGLTEARDLHPYDFSALDWVAGTQWIDDVFVQHTIVPISWEESKALFIDRAEYLNLIHV